MTSNDHMKLEVLNQMMELVGCVAEKKNVLGALDRDTSTTGSHDLSDQLMSLSDTLGQMEGVLTRMLNIVPDREAASKVDF